MQDSATYIVGVKLGTGMSHLTIKYLGNLSATQIEEWKSRINDVAASNTKFELAPAEVKVLGRSSQKWLTKTFKQSERIDSVFQSFNEDADQIPHVTFNKVDGGYNDHYSYIEGDTLIENIQLIRITNNTNYEVVHSAPLGRRTKFQVIKDILS